ncbi:MAG: site-specific DNA-methyltransferase, partial [Candidatus Thorarchaeota archaeon]
MPEESINFNGAENVFIEGENLEVLKLLQKSYHGKVKMIYIDPPYNTGNEFIYPDDYKEPLRQYLRLTGQVSKEGVKLTTNTETSGRYHSNWLSMMYPRLFLARSLLREDGVIFVSIDDHEVHNLRLLMDETFGPENFCGTIKRKAARKTAFLSKTMSDVCDYVVIYSRGPLSDVLSVAQVKDDTRPVLNATNKPSRRIVRAGTEARCDDGIYAAGEYTTRSLSFTLHSELVVASGKVTIDTAVTAPWRVNQDILDKTLYITRNFSFRRYLLSKEKSKAKTLNDLLDESTCYNEKGTECVSELLQAQGVFDNPKPVGLVKYLIRASEATKNDVVLDFFAGSGTTAHAVLDLNKQDGGNRKFILVQLPEPLDPNNKDQKAGADFCDSIGKPRNIVEITKERVRRVIQ